MKPLLFLNQEWVSGVGEQTKAMHAFLRVIDFIKEKYPNRFHIKFRVFVYGAEAGLTFEGIKAGLNIPLLESLVDEFEIDSNLLRVLDLNENPTYKCIGGNAALVGGQPQSMTKAIFFRVEEFDAVVAEEIRNFIVELFYHPCLMNDFSFSRFDININPKNIYSDILNTIADEWLYKLKLESFESIHFRLHGPNAIQTKGKLSYWWWTPEEEKEHCLTYIDLFEISSDKKYFISSSSNIFKKLMKERYDNVYFIDRETACFDKREGYGKEPLPHLPSIIPEGIFTSLSFQEISEFLAMLDLVVMSKSSLIIHAVDYNNYRDMITYFLWYPLVVKNIPFKWINRQFEPICGQFDGYGLIMK